MTRSLPTVDVMPTGTIRVGRWYVMPDGLVAVQDEPAQFDLGGRRLPPVMAVRSVDEANDLIVALVAWAERHEPGMPLPVPVQHVIYEPPPRPRADG